MPQLTAEALSSCATKTRSFLYDQVFDLLALSAAQATMAFNPNCSPVYGGGVLSVSLWSTDGELGVGVVPEDGGGAVSAVDELYLVMEGQRQVHITTLRHTEDSLWLAPIPAHSCAEQVNLCVYRRVSSDQYDYIARGDFTFWYDSAYYLAEFLINSVNNPRALEDLELLRTENFDLANEIIDTLDARLCAALKYLPFPDGWHMLGSEPYGEQELECRETLLHLAGRLGLLDTAIFLMTKWGSVAALVTMNHEGQYPCAVASSNGFDDIAELFSGYNTSGMVSLDDEQLETENGIIRSHGNIGVSLTTSGLDQNRTLVACIEVLREVAAMRRGRSPALQRQYQTEWPSPPLPPRHCHGRSFDTQDTEPSIEAQVEETLERITQAQLAHSDVLAPYLQEYDQPLDQNGQPQSLDYDKFSHPGVEADQHSCGFLEGSITSARNISNGLMRLRGSQILRKKRMEPSLLRHLQLSRFSSSCPSLAKKEAFSLPPIQEQDQHRSLQDLPLETSPLAGDLPLNDAADCGFLVPTEDSESGDWDQTVRICVNGITVDSAEDVSRGSGEKGATVRQRRLGQASVLHEEDLRRRSWCLDSSRTDAGDLADMAGLPSRRLALSGKSVSLSGLDQDETYEKLGQPTDGYVSPSRHSVLTTHGHVSSLDSATEIATPLGSHFPEADNSFDSTDSCNSGKEMDEGRGGEQLGSSEMVVAHSMSDLSSPQLVNGSQRSHVRSMAGVGGTQSYEEGRTMLGVPLSNMTKSLSTPSIPAATQAAAAAAQGRRGSKELREGKQLGDLPLNHAQTFVDDYDPTFQRQDEIEEEEDEGGEKKQMTWTDFLNEDSGAGDSDEKSKGSALRKEKKRKSSFFARTFQSYRDSTKKHKDKDNKSRPSHRFLAVSFSNARTCDVCHKPMANKPALRCDNCLINVHEHGCKEQVPNCDKNSNMKILPREGSAPAGLVQEKPTLTGSSLRPTQSFKKDRSSSTSGVVVKNPNLMAFTTSSHRHSVPAASKAISETDETDAPVPYELLHSNITETTSESLESLDAVLPIESSILDEEPDLQLGVEEQEAWNITVDKRTLKRMHAKDIKRQDTIWELVQTEKQYVKRLKIMQKMFRDPLLQRARELNLMPEQVERMFPRLDSLYELHAAFLRTLLKLQSHSADRSVEDLGPTLLEQFSGPVAEKMKSAYGHFCSRHTDAIHMYKELAKNDRNFQIFCKKTSNVPVCEKRELPDFILGVTVRLSKYPILIDAVFKSTRDKKERELLKSALECSKMVVAGVDQQVAAYEKLMEVYRAFDNRTTLYMGKKFKRQDLIANGRHLLHAGSIGWKTARGQVLETYALVLTDIMVFLQKSDMKYSFFSRDDKSSVVPLSKLLVREKADERQSNGIYVICQHRHDPEMYELVCRTQKERDDWISMLKDATKNCPEEEEMLTQPSVPLETITEEERRRQDERAKKIKDIIEQLHQKDDIIRKMCEEKNMLMKDLMDFSTLHDSTSSQPSSQSDFSTGSSVEVVQAAMQEVSRLTTILQEPSTQLSRSVSSAGEHTSMSYISMVLPKRAETFAGFDTSFEVPKSGALLKKRLNEQYADEDGRCHSDLSLHGNDTIPEDEVTSTFLPNPSSQPSLSMLSSSTSFLPRGSPQQTWEDPPAEQGEPPPLPPGLDHGDHGSPGEITSLSQSPRAQVASIEQMTSVVQLVKYLNNLMNLTAKQTTTVESLRAELSEAKEEISKLSQDMHGHRRTGLRPNQLEELRNLQESISRERQQWLMEKEREQQAIMQERALIQEQQKLLEKREADLRNKKEDLRREKETLQRQVDMMRQQGLLASSTLSGNHHIIDTVDLDRVPTEPPPPLPPATATPPGHRRAASADFQHGKVPVTMVDDVFSQHGMSRRPRHSVSNLSSSVKPSVPAHLLSTRNEQRLGGASVQQLPLKLSSSKSGSGGGLGEQRGGGRPPLQQQHPAPGPPAQHQLQPATRPNTASLGSRPGGYGPATSTPSARQAQGMITRNQHSNSAPSGLGMMMKLAEPGHSKGGGGSPSFPAQSTGGGAGGDDALASGSPKVARSESSSGEIYF